MFAVASQMKFILRFQKGCVSDCAHAGWEASCSLGALPAPRIAAQGRELWHHIMLTGKEVIKECCNEVTRIGGVPHSVVTVS